MSDDIKKAAYWCVNETTCLGCPSDLTSTAFCRERFARAYLALREQVETVALPALINLVACHDDDEGMDEFGDDESVGTEEGIDGIRKDMKLTFGILRRARAAIKAIEEGRA